MTHSINKQTALLLGGGYVARALVPALQARGVDVCVTTRSGETDIAGVRCLRFDGTASEALLSTFRSADLILSSIPPNRQTGEDVALTAFAGLQTRARWIGYLSATSVYGDRDGGWAFEHEWPTPGLKRGQHRADAEISWIETGWPVHIFRLAGIYGAGRTPFDKLRAGSARAVIKPGHVVNRIHVEDIISALLASIDAPNPQAIYNLADGHPAPPQDVLDFAANLLDLPRPERVEVTDKQISDMARSFYAESKRVDITKAQREFGWAPKYKTYREGLRQVLRQES
jgi:nucleoside-diphosphate-sugar epimerase